MKISICVIANTNNLQEIHKINETWGNDALCKEKGVNVSFIMNEPHPELLD
jgi:hypothetical protein